MTFSKVWSKGKGKKAYDLPRRKKNAEAEINKLTKPEQAKGGK